MAMAPQSSSEVTMGLQTDPAKVFEDLILSMHDDSRMQQRAAVARTDHESRAADLPGEDPHVALYVRTDAYDYPPPGEIPIGTEILFGRNYFRERLALGLCISDNSNGGSSTPVVDSWRVMNQTGRETMNGPLKFLPDEEVLEYEGTFEGNQYQVIYDPKQPEERRWVIFNKTPKRMSFPSSRLPSFDEISQDGWHAYNVRYLDTTSLDVLFKTEQATPPDFLAEAIAEFTQAFQGTREAVSKFLRSRLGE